MNPSNTAESELLELAKGKAAPDLARVRALLPAIENINFIDPRGGLTALHWAAFNGHDKLVPLLVEEAGADINSQTSTGFHAAYFAGANFGATGNSPDQIELCERQDTIYRYLMRKGTSYHQLGDHVSPENETFRERWFGDASDTWKRWSETRDITSLTPRMLVQFASHGSAHKALEYTLWRGHEAQLRDLLASPEIAPCHLEHWLTTIPGLNNLISTPDNRIHSEWTIAQAPHRSASRA